MITKQTLIKFAFGVLLVLPVTFFATQHDSVAARCGGVDTAIINCDQDNTDKNGTGTVEAQETGVWGILRIIVNILIAGVAVVALAGVVYGAVLYTSAGGNTEQVKKAMGIFTNVVIGVVAFGAMWVLLNFLIPGGAFNNI